MQASLEGRMENGDVIRRVHLPEEALRTTDTFLE